MVSSARTAGAASIAPIAATPRIVARRRRMLPPVARNTPASLLAPRNGVNGRRNAVRRIQRRGEYREPHRCLVAAPREPVDPIPGDHPRGTRVPPRLCPLPREDPLPPPPGQRPVAAPPPA